MSEIKLGQKVKDSITGFEGIAIAKCEYLNGTSMYEVTASDSSNKLDSHWIDTSRLKEVE